MRQQPSGSQSRALWFSSVLYNAQPRSSNPVQINNKVSRAGSRLKGPKAWGHGTLDSYQGSPKKGKWEHLQAPCPLPFTRWARLSCKSSDSQRLSLGALFPLLAKGYFFQTNLRRKGGKTKILKCTFLKVKCHLSLVTWARSLAWELGFWQTLITSRSSWMGG